MISVFNGRSRDLGGTVEDRVFVQVNVRFRDYLNLFRGPQLAMFLAIALHGNEGGWAWPSLQTLSRETGYGPHAVSRALNELCEIEIEGYRLLLRGKAERADGGQFSHNVYLLFPSEEEVRLYDGKAVPSAVTTDGRVLPLEGFEPTPPARLAAPVGNPQWE